MKHLKEEDLLRLLDGELTENEAVAAREHAASCDVCRAKMTVQERILRAVRAPVPTSRDTGALVEELMSRIAREDGVVGRSSARRSSRLVRGAVAGGIVVVAAGLALFVGWPRGPSNFTARGGTGTGGDEHPAEVDTLSREVGVRVAYVDGATFRDANGAVVSSDTGYAAIVRNVGNVPAYALVFAVDAANAVHWIAPMYVEPSADPPSIPIGPRTEDVAHRPVVALDRPVPGNLRFFAVVTRRPKHVSDVERHPFDPTRLRAWMGDAVVEELGAATVRP